MPRASSVFLSILVFYTKGISNGVQTEQNLREDLSWTKSNPEDLELKSVTLDVATRQEGAPRG